jgi:hypothetical protein
MKDLGSLGRNPRGYWGPFLDMFFVADMFLMFLIVALVGIIPEAVSLEECTISTRCQREVQL